MYVPPPKWTGRQTTPSLDAPVSRAFEVTKHILTPIDGGKWLGIGFCAWLVGLGEGGGGLSNIGNVGDLSDLPSGEAGRTITDGITALLGAPVAQFFATNMPLIIAGIIGVVVAVIGLSLLIRWVQSRADFMLMDNILNNRGEIKAPWSKYRELGFSLFITRILIDLIVLGSITLLVAAGTVVAFGANDPFSLTSVAAFFIIIVLLFPIILASLAAKFIISTLLIPTMYLDNQTAKMAWPRVKGQLISGHWGDLGMYSLVRLALNVGIGIATMVITVVTCCVPVIPFVGTIILLPFTLFLRAHQLAFFEELSGDTLFNHEASPAK